MNLEEESILTQRPVRVRSTDRRRGLSAVVFWQTGRQGKR